MTAPLLNLVEGERIMVRRSKVSQTDRAVTACLRWVRKHHRRKPNPQTAYGLTLLSIYAPESAGLGRTTPVFRNEVRLAVLRRLCATTGRTGRLRTWQQAAEHLIQAERRASYQDVKGILDAALASVR